MAKFADLSPARQAIIKADLSALSKRVRGGAAGDTDPGEAWSYFSDYVLDVVAPLDGDTYVVDSAINILLQSIGNYDFLPTYISELGFVYAYYLGGQGGATGRLFYFQKGRIGVVTPIFPTPVNSRYFS